MKTIRVKNVNHALSEGFWHLKISGEPNNSRNGPVLAAPGPVVTTYTHPWERVLFNPLRDANPVFHLLEGIWMLAGRDNVNDLLPFNSKFYQYAEDNGVVHGAYGYRWRDAFSLDQIVMVIEMLCKDSKTRRAVIQMWDADQDLGANKRDIPCNTHIYFDASRGRLDMTVCCRSNDILWGAYGANAVHMSMLQEVVARGANLAIGNYHQFSNNFHAYMDLPMVKRFTDVPPEIFDPYENGIQALPMMEDNDYETFLVECENFWKGPYLGPNKFLRMANVLRTNYGCHKEGRALKIPTWCNNIDFVEAFLDWTIRRMV